MLNSISSRMNPVLKVGMIKLNNFRRPKQTHTYKWKNNNGIGLQNRKNTSCYRHLMTIGYIWKNSKQYFYKYHKENIRFCIKLSLIILTDSVNGVNVDFYAENELYSPPLSLPQGPAWMTVLEGVGVVLTRFLVV